MRLDARKGDTDWGIWDAKRCCVPLHVVWVDSDTAAWGQFDLTSAMAVFMLFGAEAPTKTHQEERISIYPSKRLVIFNEIDLGDDKPAATHTEQPKQVTA